MIFLSRHTLLRARLGNLKSHGPEYSHETARATPFGQVIGGLTEQAFGTNELMKKLPSDSFYNKV
jgi:hypothetical protein